MSAIAKVSRPDNLNRRRRVRQRAHAPAYASFVGASRGEMIDLYEVLDISEVGLAIQCPSQLEANQQVNLCLDLAESSGQITSSARVVWSDSRGRTGLALPPLGNPALHRLREWLFLNAMAAAANASANAVAAASHSVVRPNFTDTLNAATVIQREAESLGADLESVLALLAARSQSLLRASGAAIALAGLEEGTMTCRASAGECSPPVGATLQIGSGFSGECVRTGNTLRCDDAALDDRVDRDNCLALGIRSILAVPIRSGAKTLGLIEAFAAEPNAFDDHSAAVLQRFAETIVAALNRVAKKNTPPPPPVEIFKPSPGSILFAQAPSTDAPKNEAAQDAKVDDQDKVGGIRLPKAHLYLLICAAATIFLALGFITAPWIQPWISQKLHSRDHSGIGEETVLASSQPAEAVKAAPVGPTVDSANIDQLREMAENGNSAAEDRLGRIYAEGDDKQGVKPDDEEAARWFTSAAEHGSVSAQYKLGLLYWGGHHGVPKDANKAYFWTVLARAGGQEGSKDLATFLANGMTRAQAASIEQQADNWYRQHEPQAKPSAGH